MKPAGLFNSLAASGLLTATLSAARAIHDPLSGFPGVSFKRVRSNKNTPKPLDFTTNVVPIKRIPSSQGIAHAGADVALGFVQRQTGEGYGYANVTSANKYGTSFAMEVDFNGHTMPLIIDSGSSDTWAVTKGFTCVDWLGMNYTKEFCGFGAAYPGGFNGDPIENQHFFVQYGSGEQVSGPVGKLDVSVGGLTVMNQTVGLANMTYWHGNNYTAGLMGLAYPTLTSAYWGTDQTKNSPISQAPYNPLFTEMMNQGVVHEPVWSIAINRNSSDGQIAFGGMPVLPGLWDRAVGYTDIIITQMSDSRPQTAFKPSFYTIIPDGVVYGQASDSVKYPYIVDTGTTLMYLPPPLAEAINAAFDPPARYVWMYGGYFTTCDAIPPRFSVVIGGQAFWINPVDMMFRNFKDPVTGLCQTSITSGGTGPYILGSTFLQNTLSVFDVGNQLMQFYSRPYY